MNSGSTTYYRKYRPATWDEVAGQKIPKRVMENSLKRSKPAHAYLLCGPRGTGKTTSARIFAAALNCTQRQGANPCLKCSSCLSFHNGTYPDYIEIDAASNRKIEDFRGIRDQVQYPPMAGKNFYKVYVIDEVHMLGREAANSFLKTLEEPPPYLVFLLATTEPERLPPTIVSRCIRLDFELLSSEECIRRLEEVIQSESLNISKPVLDHLYRRAGGGMREVLSLLEQAVQLCGPHIELSDYLKSMGLPTIEVIDRLLEAHSQTRSQEILELYRELVKGGCTPQGLVELLLQRIRDYLAYHFRAKVEYEEIPQEVVSRSPDFWVQTFQAYLRILDSMRNSLHPELHGEMGLLVTSRDPSALCSNSPASAHPDGLIASLEQRVQALEKRSFERLEPEAIETQDLRLERYPEAEKNWKLVLKEFKKEARMSAPFFENALARIEEERLCLYFDPKFEFHYKKAQENKALATLQKLVKEQFGNHLLLKLILGNPKDLVADRSDSINDYQPSVERNQERSSFSEDLQEKLLQDPGIRTLVDELGAVIKNVD